MSLPIITVNMFVIFNTIIQGLFYPQFLKRCDLDLPDPLPGYTMAVANLLEGVAHLMIETIEAHENVCFPVAKGGMWSIESLKNLFAPWFFVIFHRLAVKGMMHTIAGYIFSYPFL
jgi:hypothetical protein